ncbi:MAG TPA: hypothetical protein VMS88_07855, partial [Terriglobales bacterium]|nr:hypothetical protein [Terriglobales bacterium]
DPRARLLARGDTLLRDPPIVVLWPPRGRAAGGNNGGLVLSAGRDAGRLLFLADVDTTIEDSLAFAPGIGLLKVGHHGASSSTGARLLARAGPAIALLSVGARNRFGHPAPDLLARLAAAGAGVRRTDVSGALWFEWSPEGVRELDWRRARPWHIANPRAPCAPVRLPRSP